jgi:glutathione S-transferase
MGEVTFFYNPWSRAQIVRWMLEEVGAPYTIRAIDFEKGDNRTPEFLAINPMGKIPTIVHDGVTVTESGAILAYLADAFPAAGMAPAIGDPRRGSWYRWLFFTAGCLEPAAIDVMMKRPAPENPRAVGWGSFGEVLAALKQTLQGSPWLLGEQFTAADLYVAAELHWMGQFGAPGVDDPVLADFTARAIARPAFARAGGEA